ncbi:unknown [Clostridium sp. CAG:433]|nr:unknown [Clostridium sp. CAG:433]
MDNSENEVLKLQKEKKGKNIVIIILVFIVALLLGIILGQYIPNNKNDKKTENIAKDEIKKNNNSTTKKDEKQNTSTNTNDTSTSTSSSDNSNTNTVQKSDSDIVKELFIQNLKNIYGDNLIEYRIDNIKIYTGSEREELAQMYENNSSIEIYSLVNYSIRLKDISKDAGNGTESGDWVYDKTACVTIIKDANGNRNINAGTGW